MLHSSVEECDVRHWSLGVVDAVRFSDGIVLKLAALEWARIVRAMLSPERVAAVLAPESLLT